MNIRLSSVRIIHREQTDDHVSFQACFLDEERDWVCTDIKVKKSEFRKLSELLRTETARGCQTE